MTTTDNNSTSDRDLVLTRLIDAPREKLYRAWTDPELMKKWFAPAPVEIALFEADVRPGGRTLLVMKTPDGREIRCPGTYLELVPNEKIVFTDAYVGDWEPSEKPFITAIVTFAEEDGKTRYTATIRHWTVADRQTHEAMGFREGWGQCADQLEELVKTLD